MSEFTVTRTFDAPREQVYKAWTEPEYLTHWFGAPLPTISMDVRPGGVWRATMVYEDQEIPFAGLYREVRAPERLVFGLVDAKGTGEAEAAAGEGPEEVVTVTLTDLGDKTEMVFTQVGQLPEETAAQAKEGWGMMFDGMAETLAAR